MKKIKVGSDFSGVGAFDHALKRLNIDFENVFACDMDKYARKSYIAVHGEPNYYPENVYDREIPEESLDVYISSCPCQPFSMSGKRQGKNDEKGRGILFFNSHEFIQINKPRYFIFENVKGLLNDDSGKTFSEWITMLGGKSINGMPQFFPHEDSVPYHIYWKVLNAKDYNVPQNRERVFIIGIRDDEDNQFSFPKEEFLQKRLKDVLEKDVDEKYFLSQKMIDSLLNHQKFNKFNPGFGENESSCITSRVAKMGNSDNYIKIIGNTNPSKKGMNGNVFDSDGISPTLSTNKGEGIKIKSATSKGYELATNLDSKNLSNPSSKTRRGRVGKEVAQTLDTQCNQGVFIADYRSDEGLRARKEPIAPCLTSSMRDTEEVQPKAGTRNPPLVGEKKNYLHNSKNVINFDGKISYGKETIFEILFALQQEIGKKEVESWGLRILETIRKKSLLRQKLHEESVYGKGEKTSRGNIHKIQSCEGKKINASIIMRSLQGEEWSRCSSQRRESIKQLIRQFNESLQGLSSEDSSWRENLQSNELHKEIEGLWVLRKTLSEIQEIWESVNGEAQSILQGYRIRRLTVTEAFRLMDFPDEHVSKCKEVGVSDSQLYKQAGNSIVVRCLELIIKQFNLK